MSERDHPKDALIFTGAGSLAAGILALPGSNPMGWGLIFWGMVLLCFIMTGETLRLRKNEPRGVH